eukprot:2357746-Prymnesium_polylepis.1
MSVLRRTPFGGLLQQRPREVSASCMSAAQNDPRASRRASRNASALERLTPWRRHADNFSRAYV